MITLTDTIAIDASQFAQGKLKRTADGYAVFDCAVARIGVQDYLAAEIPGMFDDLSPTAIVRVERPAEVIFSDASLSAYAHKPLTNDHPSVPVTADNWKQYSIGHTGDEVRVENKRVRVPMLMADAAAIADVEAGKVEWSAGYSVNLERRSGVNADGQAYDAIVTGQKINHIALVDRGRAGPEFRIGDNARRETPEHKERLMPHTMIIDGLQVPDVSDAAKAAIEKLQGLIKDSTETIVSRDSDIARLTTEAATATAEIATLKQAVADAKVTPAQMRDAAAKFAKVLADAKRIAPALTLADNLDEPAVMAAVVNGKLGDAAKGWTEAQIETSFATMVASLGDDAQDDIQRVVGDGALKVADADKAANEARAAYINGLKDAHRPAAGNA